MYWENALDELARLLARRYTLAPDQEAKAKAGFRAKMFEAMAGCPTGAQARCLYRIVNGLEDLAPFVANAVAGTPRPFEALSAVVQEALPPTQAYGPVPRTGHVSLSVQGEIVFGRLSEQIVRAKVAQRVDVVINSRGASTVDALSLHEALRLNDKPASVHVQHACASAATLALLAGNERVGEENARFMCHPPWLATFGTARELREAADQLGTLEARQREAYARHCPANEASRWETEEVFYSLVGALRIGPLTKVVPPAPPPPWPDIKPQLPPLGPDAAAVDLLIQLLRRLRQEFKDPAIFGEAAGRATGVFAGK
jgi:hypothetical protein